jgi:DNA mismatch repair protein MutL
MSKIKILPETLSNKIAAGEVVERPASAVKELVENALDADSTRIIIEVENGGRALIRVSDNGFGMSHDDALLAIERYATSKIYRDADLFSIQTLGFRGEALPSMAAVSRFALVSREESAETGVEILVDGGKLKNVSEIGAPRGTMATVKQLFFNTPARRKFLKSIATEMSHIADIVASIAMAHSQVHFRLSHNGKIVKDWPATSSPFDRVAEVLGSDLKKELHPTAFQGDGIGVSGWIASPRVSRRTLRGVFIYVNGRFVRDRVIQHALLEGYAQRLVKGQYPAAMVLISVPFDEVDVNVHPTKNEVRFVRQRDVHDAVKTAVVRTLREVDNPIWRPAGFSTETPPSLTHRVSETIAEEFGIRDSKVSTRNPYPATRTSQLAPRTAQPAPLTRQAPIWGEKRFADFRVIGQLHQTYILCESEEGLILIDQHAAHERILFEQLSSRSKPSRSNVQQLLVPETLELGYREAAVLEKIMPDLVELGLEIEPFGGNTFVVKAVPAVLADRAIKPILTEMVEHIVEMGGPAAPLEVLAECRRVMACHSAIRAKQALSDPQMMGLLKQLDECDNPSHCPHGRPTWVRWDLQFLEKAFKRVL